jgi:CrcB protein
MDLRVVATVGAGAAIGGVARLLVSQLVAARFGASAIVYATLAINVTGSFLIGVVLEFAQLRTGANPLWRYFLATGVLGGYTTFSTFSFEALALFATPAAWTGLAYVVASITLGIFGAAAGIAVARGSVAP